MLKSQKVFSLNSIMIEEIFISIFIPASVPYNWIEEIPQDACFDEAWQTVGGK
ncbi:hypothetical protein ACIQZD_16725 [Peribacillus sp. NPDC096447]|uniref:hypothetical protein n=1 Tax=Peribacillus sp. NPDC096447 TaxID=3364394 RepID=UPI00380D71BF